MTVEFNTVSNLKLSYNLLRAGNLINKNLIDLTKQIIFIKPDIWGDAILKSEYWKDDRYHPSLFKFNKNTIKDKILLIGKVIKKKQKI